MVNIDENKKITGFEIGDIIEVSMTIEYQIPPEDEKKPIIDLTDYSVKYKIHYSYPRDLGFSILDFMVDVGNCADFCDDIQQYIEKYIKQDLNEIAEYELLDVDNKGEYQTAKVKIKAIEAI